MLDATDAASLGGEVSRAGAHNGQANLGIGGDQLPTSHLHRAVQPDGELVARSGEDVLPLT